MNKLNSPTIYTLIKQLKLIVDETRSINPNLSYFAIFNLYFTINVAKKLLKENYFEDNEKVQRLIVIYISHYITVYDKWKMKEEIPSCWKIAFDFSKNKNRMIIQNLLLGVNAQLNLDLGLATENSLSIIDENNNIQIILDKDYCVESDLKKIIKILSEIALTMDNLLVKSSVFYRYITNFGNDEKKFFNEFTVKSAENGAWNFAKIYRNGKAENVVVKRDKDICKLGREIISPSPKLIRLLFLVGGYFENKISKKFIQLLIKELDDFVDVEYHAI